MLFFAATSTSHWILERITLHHRTKPSVRILKIQGFGRKPGYDLFPGFGLSPNPNYAVAVASRDTKPSRLNLSPLAEESLSIVDLVHWKVIETRQLTGKDVFGNFGFYGNYFITLTYTADDTTTHFRAFEFPGLTPVDECDRTRGTSPATLDTCASFLHSIRATNFEDFLDTLNHVKDSPPRPADPPRPDHVCFAADRGASDVFSGDRNFAAYECENHQPTTTPDNKYFDHYELWSLPHSQFLGKITTHRLREEGWVTDNGATYFFTIISNTNRLHFYPATR